MSFLISYKLSEGYYKKDNTIIKFGIIFSIIFNILLFIWLSFVLIFGSNTREELRSLGSMCQILIHLGIIIELAVLIGLQILAVLYLFGKFEKEISTGLFIFLFYIILFLSLIIFMIEEPGFLKIFISFSTNLCF